MSARLNARMTTPAKPKLLAALPAARIAAWEKFLAQREPEQREARPTIANYEKRPQAVTFQHPFNLKGTQERTQVAPDLRLELFAAEPDISKPIFMAWDERGRLWIAENVARGCTPASMIGSPPLT